MSDASNAASNIEREIQAAVATARPSSQATHPQDATFRKIRAQVRGTLIDAHRALARSDAAPAATWTEEDDRVLDVVTLWLDKVRDRR